VSDVDTGVRLDDVLDRIAVLASVSAIAEPYAAMAATSDALR
jgi:hypothetical protein